MVAPFGHLPHPTLADARVTFSREREKEQACGVILTSATSRGEAQRALARMFTETGIESAAIDARILLCAALAIDHAALVRDPDLPLGPAALLLAAYAARRLRREPVSRILGRKEFWGLPFAIGPAVLDPRPETELLVETALAGLAARRGDRLDVLDLGTGSGAILCALLHELAEARGYGVDLAFETCRIARANAASLGLGDRSTIIQGQWTQSLRGPFDLIVSNPPYIETGDLDTLAQDVALYDPRAALDGGPDGLAPYRLIAPELPRLLRRNGLAVFEVGCVRAIGWRTSCARRG